MRVDVVEHVRCCAVVDCSVEWQVGCECGAADLWARVIVGIESIVQQMAPIVAKCGM